LVGAEFLQASRSVAKPKPTAMKKSQLIKSLSSKNYYIQFCGRRVGTWQQRRQRQTDHVVGGGRQHVTKLDHVNCCSHSSVASSSQRA